MASPGQVVCLEIQRSLQAYLEADVCSLESLVCCARKPRLNGVRKKVVDTWDQKGRLYSWVQFTYLQSETFEGFATE